MSDFDEMNREVLAEFRANAGVVDTAAGGYFKGKPVLVVHSTGARTGKARINPLMYLDEGDDRYVFASKGGAPHNPDWYHNLKANPEVTVEAGTESYPAVAREITGPERDRVYAAMADAFPQFGDYQEKTTRKIPVIALDRS
ncbi:MAG TPA: nitroreductase family deazaflavin-dependent oxidoreductase [Miltoncostaeaceae bacterium]|jgi:deazaflavin-dependent oxidoreductase (nitroreductase family)|nr:nitroreductase family deazaflavin-dependent oxidoreductase [Miltoncostaeaceae bacterium]